MDLTLFGTKLGMTRVYDENGNSMPVTVIELGENVVTQLRSPERDGYAAVQIGYADAKPRNASIPMMAHDAKAGTAPKRFHGESRVEENALDSYEVGQKLTAKDFEGVAYVDVIGTSKGKGFQGGMKRHNFKGQLASHGVERKHRSPGSIGGHASNAGKSGRIKKGKRMAGQMGNERVTVRSLDLVKVDGDRNLLLVKGPVPGANKGVVQVRASTRLYKSKGVKAAGG